MLTPLIFRLFQHRDVPPASEVAPAGASTDSMPGAGSVARLGGLVGWVYSTVRDAFQRPAPEADGQPGVQTNRRRNPEFISEMLEAVCHAMEWA